jgi:hypothetical protein
MPARSRHRRDDARVERGEEGVLGGGRCCRLCVCVCVRCLSLGVVTVKGIQGGGGRLGGSVQELDLGEGSGEEGHVFVVFVGERAKWGCGCWCGLLLPPGQTSAYVRSLFLRCPVHPLVPILVRDPCPPLAAYE